MGNPLDTAPSYEELYHNHPVNQYTPPGSVITYSQVPQEDAIPDLETESGTALQDRGDPKAHVHCEFCDRQNDRAEKRKAQKTCCWVVAFSIILITLCSMGFALAVITMMRGRR